MPPHWSPRAGRMLLLEEQPPRRETNPRALVNAIASGATVPTDHGIAICRD